MSDFFTRLAAEALNSTTAVAPAAPPEFDAPEPDAPDLLPNLPNPFQPGPQIPPSRLVQSNGPTPPLPSPLPLVERDASFPSPWERTKGKEIPAPDTAVSPTPPPRLVQSPRLDQSNSPTPPLPKGEGDASFPSLQEETMAGEIPPADTAVPATPPSRWVQSPRLDQSNSPTPPFHKGEGEPSFPSPRERTKGREIPAPDTAVPATPPPKLVQSLGLNQSNSPIPPLPKGEGDASFPSLLGETMAGEMPAPDTVGSPAPSPGFVKSSRFDKSNNPPPAPDTAVSPTPPPRLVQSPRLDQFNSLIPPTSAAQPLHDAMQPFSNAAQPSSNAAQPSNNAAQPFSDAMQPFSNAAQPLRNAEQPFLDADTPSPTAVPSPAAAIRPALPAAEPDTAVPTPTVEITIGRIIVQPAAPPPAPPAPAPAPSRRQPAVTLEEYLSRQRRTGQ